MPDAFTQLREAGELDRKGRQKRLVRRRPRERSGRRKVRRVAAPQVSPTPFEQLQEAGELDRKGRQKQLVRQGPRKLSERKRIVRRATGDVELVALPRYRRQRRRFEREEREWQAGERRRQLVSALRESGWDVSRQGRDTDTHIGPFNLEAELEGRGGVAKAAEWAKRHLVNTETGRQALRTAGLPVPYGRLGENVAKDLVDIPTQAVPSVYMTVAGVKEAAQGDPARIKDLWRDYKATSAIPAAVEGDFGEALRRAEQHPLSTALEVSGAKAVVGRTAGGALRKAPSRKVRRVASTTRNDLRLYPREIDTERRNLRDVPSAQRRRVKAGPRVERRYSRDVINKGLQVAGERIQRRRGRDPDVDPGRRSLSLADQTPVRRKLLRQVDTDIYGGEGIRRRRREQAVRDTVRSAPPEHEPIARLLANAKIKPHWSPVVQLVAEGVVRSKRTFRADLRRELERLEAAYPQAGKRSKGAARLNRVQREQIERVIADDSVDVDAVFDAAREFTTAERGRQARLRELGQYTDAEHSKRFYPYLQTHHGLEGEALEAAARTLERRRRKGKHTPVDPAFVTQKRVKTAGSMYLPTMRGNAPPAPNTRRRTGKGYEQGARELGGEPLLRQAALSEGLATAVENFHALTNKYGVASRRDGGYARSYTEADRLGRELTEDAAGNLKPGHVALVPVNVAPFRSFGDKLARVQKQARPGANIDGRVADVFAEAVRTAFEKPTSERSGKYLLIPEDVAARIKEHQFTRVRGEKALESLTNTFKDVVLTTSSPTTWLAGNVTDLGVRSALAGLRPTDIGRGMRVVRRAKQIDRRRGEELEQSLVGGGLYHSGSRARVHRPTRVGQSKAGRVAAAPYRAWRDGVFAVERMVEELPQYAAVGKQMREDVQMQRSLKGLLKTSRDQVDHFADNLVTNPALEARIQNQVEDVIGRWGKVSPTMRRALGVGPFAQWLAAALRYVYVTLPVHHPVKTGIAAGMYEMTDAERRKLGLTLKGDPDTQVLDYLQGSIPIGEQKRVPVLDKNGERIYRDGKLVTKPEGDLLRTARLTSFGTAAAFPENLPEFVLPQLNSPSMALRGVSWTGDRLVYPEGHPKAGQEVPREKRREIALGLLIEGTFPFAAPFRRAVQEGGRPSHPTSQVLDPQTRKRWDQDTRRYREQQGGLTQGLSDWINPLGVSNRLTQGDVEAIESAVARGKVFEELRRESEAKKADDSWVDRYADGAERPYRKVKRSQSSSWVDDYADGGRPRKARRKKSWVDSYAD